MTEATLQEVLQIVCERNSCPIVRFELENSQNDEVMSVALDNALIDRAEDTMEQVRQRAEALELLERNGYVMISYDAVMEYDDEYDVARQSELYAYFQSVVAEARAQKDFTFDSGRLQKGVVLLTEKGKKARAAGRFGFAHEHHHEDCDCGHDHHHHHEDCDCGHEHHHHREGCNCGHHHE